MPLVPAMPTGPQGLGDRIASAVLHKFDSLKPRGKPQGREWSVLAGIVAQDTRCTSENDDSYLRVVSLATGNKCVGRGKIPADGSVVHDSHAEVLARRALLLRLWKELDLLISTKQGEQPATTGSPPSTGPSTSRLARCGNDGLGVNARVATAAAAAAAASRGDEAAPSLNGGLLANENKMRPPLLLLLLPEPTAEGVWRLKPHVRLHLYISDAPCGDASIYEQTQAPLPLPQPLTPPPPQAPNVSEREALTASAGTEPQAPARFLCADTMAKTPTVQSSSVPAGVDASPTVASIHPEGTGHAANPCACHVGCGGGDGGGHREDVGTSVLCDDERTHRERVKRCRCAADDKDMVSSMPCTASGASPLEGKESPDKRKIRTSEEEGDEEEEDRRPTTEKRMGGGGRTEVMAFTGAKIIASVRMTEEYPGTVLGGDLDGPTVRPVLRIDREQEQRLGALRIKSSRSNILEEGRTMSLSCSDKLAKWALLGLQGGLLASWVEPFFLSSIVISANPRADGPAPLLSALRRAVPGRAAAARRSSDQLMMEHSSRADVEVFVTSVVFDKSKAQSEQRALNAEPNSASQLEVSPLPRTSSTMHVIEDRGRRNRGSKKGRRSRQPKVVPSGTSLNWIDALLTGRGDGPGGGGGRSVQAEVTLSATGRMQGAVSKGILTTRMRSRLCRACLLEAAEQVARLYLPRTAPMGDDGPAAYDSDKNTGKEEEEEDEEEEEEKEEEEEEEEEGEEEKEMPHNVSRSGPPAASPSCSQYESSGIATVIAPVVPSNRMLSSDGVDSTADDDGGGGCTSSTEGGVERGPDLPRQQQRRRRRRSYWNLKQANGAHRARRAAMLSTPSFSAWLVGSREQQEFAVDEHGIVPLLSFGRA